MRTRKVYGVVAKVAKPTNHHRPALWAGLLGTVYAMSPDDRIRYFDYDIDGAKKFAGVDKGVDPRFYKYTKFSTGELPRIGQKVLWVR